MGRFLTRVAVFLTSLIACLALPHMAAAQDWSRFTLRTIDFAVPADWQQTHRQRDQEYDFESPDGRYTLWARWWFPDEPLLGYPDIVGHDTLSLAGQRALYIHVGPENERMLQLAFLKQDGEGEQFLFQLIGKNVPLEDHRQMLQTLMAQLVVEGVPVIQATAATPPPTQGADLDADASTNANTDARTIQLATPQGWRRAEQTSADLSYLIAVSPDQQRLVLVAAGWGPEADAKVEEVQALLYRDSVVVKSIEGEYYPEIAGSSVHAIQTIAKVFAITGVELPYSRARVGIFRSTAADRSFLILTVRDENAAKATGAELERIATGLRFGATQAPTPQAPPPQAPPTAIDQPRDTPAAPVVTADSGTPGGSKKSDGNRPKSDAPSVVEDVVDPAPTLPTAPAVVPAIVPTLDSTPAQAQPATAVLFDGHDQTGWQSFGFEGGDFASHADASGPTLEIHVPQDLGWAKTGLRSTVPVVHMPTRDDTRVTRLAVTIDADASNSLVVALTPAELLEEDPWEGHDLRLYINKNSDGIGVAVLQRRDVSSDLTARFPWPTGVTRFDLLLRPDQVLDLQSGTGERLAWFDLVGGFADRDWGLQVYTHTGNKNRAVSLSLHQVVLDQAAPTVLPDIDQPADGPRNVALFDGTFTAPIWAPFERWKHTSLEVSRLGDGALHIGWPEDIDIDHMGIHTPQTALWLDRFDDTAVARITLHLDGAASGDFEFGLRPSFLQADNGLGNGDYALSFRRQEDGTFLFHSSLKTRDPEVVQAGLTAIPDTITVVLTRRGIGVDGEGLPTEVVPHDVLRDAVGLRFFLSALKPDSGAARLVLKGIETDLTPGLPRPAPTPADGVDPLPVTVLFDGALGDAWTPVSQGDALFDDLAQITSQGLRLSRRDTLPDSNRIALVSAAPIVALDERIRTTPFDVHLSLDPAQTDLGGRILFSTNPDNPTDSANFAVTLRELQTGPNAGQVQLKLHAGNFFYNHWTRTLPAGYRDSWSGDMTVRFADERVLLLLDDRVVMSAKADNSAPLHKFHVAILPGGISSYDGGQITLKRLETGWRTYQGMTAIERMQFVDSDTFDPAGFVDLLVQGAAGQ